MKFVTFEMPRIQNVRVDSRSVDINPMHVSAVKPSSRWPDMETEVYMIGGAVFPVDMPRKEVLRLLKGETP